MENRYIHSDRKSNGTNLFESEFKEIVTLAKELELRWFEFYTPQNITRFDYTPNRNNCVIEKYTPKHCMPILRRNLSYIREDTTAQNFFKSNSHKKREFKKEEDLTIQNGNSKKDEKSEFLNNRIPMKKRKRFNDAYKSLNLTVGNRRSGINHDGDVNNQLSLVEGEIHVDVVKTTSDDFSNATKASDSTEMSSSVEQNTIPYNPITMGPPIMKEIKHPFTLFSKAFRKTAKNNLPPQIRFDKEKVRDEIVRLWNNLNSSELNYWIQVYQRYQIYHDKQWKSYFKSFHSKSSQHYRRSVLNLASTTNNIDFLKPTKVFFFYKHMSYDHFPVILVESRKDMRCPLCFFRAVSCRGIMIHLSTFHSQLLIECGLDENKNLHVSLCRDKVASSKSSVPEHLRNFHHIRHPEQINSIECNQIKFMKRSINKACQIENSIRKRKLNILKKYGADKDTISRFIRSDQIPIRQYYHSRTNLPLSQYGWEHDSDDDSDDEWYHGNCKELFFEFEDVIGDEKEFMMLWNIYIKSHVLIPDAKLSQKCLQFIQLYAHKHSSTNFRNNLLQHLFNLWDNGILSSKHIFDCMDIYDKIQKRRNQNCQTLKSHVTIV